MDIAENIVVRYGIWEIPENVFQPTGFGVIFFELVSYKRLLFSVHNISLYAIK